MIYDSLDIIPLKLYLKIDATNNISLLTDDNKVLNSGKLPEIWRKLKTDYLELGISAGAKKILDVSVRIEKLHAKYNFVISATNVLNFERVEDFENTLREWGYKLRPKTYMEDLQSIKNQAAGILTKIKRLELQINRSSPNKERQKNRTIDELIMGYISATGVQYNTNEITVTQFHALQMLFNSKLKEIEKQKQNAPQHQKLKKNG